MFIDPNYYSKETQPTPKQHYGFWEKWRRANAEGRKLDSMSCSNYCKSRGDTKTQAAFEECMKDCEFFQRLSEWHRRN
jgi:hypothetical protein